MTNIYDNKRYRKRIFSMIVATEPKENNQNQWVPQEYIVAYPNKRASLVYQCYISRAQITHSHIKQKISYIWGQETRQVKIAGTEVHVLASCPHNMPCFPITIHSLSHKTEDYTYEHRMRKDKNTDAHHVICCFLPEWHR